MTSSTRGWQSYFAHPLHGPLPAILVYVTLITGVVDAMSILALGRVFVANMTGNVVFIAFAIGGAPGFSLLGSVLALAGFVVGATAGGGLIARMKGRRGSLLRNTLLVQTALTVCAVAVHTSPNIVVLLAAIGLGLQNAAVRHLAVPDMTTTVLTMAITGIGSDIRKRDGAAVIRRLLSVGAMFAGALVGTLVVLHSGVTPTLILIIVLYAVAAVVVAVVRVPEPSAR
ncbi:YoaK family protein [Actinomycetes bacterium M1A6_2h]